MKRTRLSSKSSTTSSIRRKSILPSSSSLSSSSSSYSILHTPSRRSTRATYHTPSPHSRHAAGAKTLLQYDSREDEAKKIKSTNNSKRKLRNNPTPSPISTRNISTRTSRYKSPNRDTIKDQEEEQEDDESEYGEEAEDDDDDDEEYIEEEDEDNEYKKEDSDSDNADTPVRTPLKSKLRSRPYSKSSRTPPPPLPPVLFECSRCHHLFLSQLRLRSHQQRKYSCSPYSHLTSPTTGLPPAISLSPYNQSLAKKRWMIKSDSNGNKTIKLNLNAFIIRLEDVTLETIKLNITRRKADERLDPNNVSNEFVCHANEVITMKLIRHSNELFHEFGSFHPIYTHQLFSDEECVGYKRLNVTLFFTAQSLFAYLNVDFEEKLPKGCDQVYEVITSKLPKTSFTTNIEQFEKHITAPFTPPGNKIHEYILPSVDTNNKDTVVYEIYHGTFSSKGMREYHERLQFFLLFFIDRSSFINADDPVWEILLLFEKRVANTKSSSVSSRDSSNTTYNIVGYTTLYKFFSYNSYPSSSSSSSTSPLNWRLRLSQILILPPYQRVGHGQKLLQLVYDITERRKFTELNIEDPAPLFQFLRDLTDVNKLKKLGIFQKTNNNANDGLDNNINSPSSSGLVWDSQLGQQLSKQLRIPLAQVRRCYEIFKLSQIDIRHNINNGGNNSSYTAYRIEVKKRLMVEREEELFVECRGEEERKERLHQWYIELEQHYLSVIKKARIH